MVSEVSPFRQYQELNHAQPQQVQYLPPQCCSCKRHKMMSDDIIVISLYFLDKNKVQTSVSTPILQSSQHKGRLLYHHKGQASPIHQKVQDSSQAVDGSKINQCQSFSNSQKRISKCSCVRHPDQQYYHHAAIVNDNFLIGNLWIFFCNLTATLKVVQNKQ